MLSVQVASIKSDIIGLMNLVYTDGSSRGNPGRGAYAFISMIDGNVYEYGESFDNVTNNQMEIMAVIASLEHIKAKGYRKVLIRSDSEYVVKGVTLWLSGWKRNNWKTSSKSAVKNQDLWQKLDGLLEDTKDREVSFEHVFGHNGEKYNERVDKLCTSLATGKEINFYKGQVSGYNAILD